MFDRTPRRLLLALGVLVWATLSSLHAQPESGPAKKPSAPPMPTPPSSTPDHLRLPMFLSSSPPAVNLQFKIDPKTPLKDLLPVPPKVNKIAAPLLDNDLTHVLEVQFQAPQNVANNEAMIQIAHQIAKINHLNAKKRDGFLEALRGERLDLHGLPFAMGDACRTKGERSRQFALAVATVRSALVKRMVAVPVENAVPVPVGGKATGSLKPSQSGALSTLLVSTLGPNTVSTSTEPPDADTFWMQYTTIYGREDRKHSQIDREKRETITQARIAALMQVLAPMSPEMHLGLVKYLSTLSHVEATHALARLAIFSAAEEVRRTALDALKVRRERDYTEILVKGLRYPWPDVARRAAEAVAKLERTDLLAQLVEMLEAPDPRAPRMREVHQKQTPMVRELVRVNHHRNCLLCHAPGNTGKVSPDTLSAAVPVPGEPLTPPSGGYNTSRTEILVRLDVTYLRPDFSTLQAVADANPWPEMQRFDFLVRERTLTEEEAAAYREKLTPREAGQFSPYQHAALAALRDLTGRDTAPTPEAWRQLLKLPAEQRKTKTP